MEYQVASVDDVKGAKKRALEAFDDQVTPASTAAESDISEDEGGSERSAIDHESHRITIPRFVGVFVAVLGVFLLTSAFSNEDDAYTTTPCLIFLWACQARLSISIVVLTVLKWKSQALCQRIAGFLPLLVTAGQFLYFVTPVAWDKKSL